MLTITLLGTAATMPLPDRALSAAFAACGGHGLLWDCGEGTQAAAHRAGVNLMRADAICLTHYHGDHIFGLPGLLQTLGAQGRTRPLALLGPEGLPDIWAAVRALTGPLPYPVKPQVLMPGQPLALDALSEGWPVTFCMNLDERDLKKIKSLHVMLKMPIWILEKETNKVLKSYESIYKHPISYGFKEKNISEETVQFYSGILNEIFLCLWYKDIKIVIGAFRINNVTRADFSHVYNNMDDENKKNLSETECWEYYEALPVYPLGDIRDYLILLGFLFDMDLEDIYSEGLHEQVAKNKLELEKKPSEEEVYDTFRVERYTFYYENKIMNLVSQGDIQLLKSGLTELGTSVLPILTSSSLKTEKNYTVIILEKLASLAI